mgnify:CR=1 FL=1
MLKIDLVMIEDMLLIVIRLKKILNGKQRQILMKDSTKQFYGILKINYILEHLKK